MAKLTLKQRATKFSFKRDGFSDFSIRRALKQGMIREDESVDGWLAGYRAAQRDEYMKTYSRTACSYCQNPKTDGHKHQFHMGCGRTVEHCECGIDWVKEGMAVERE